VAALGASRGLTGLAPRIVVGMVPVELRVIKKELDSLLAALVGQLFKGIFSIRSGIDDVPLVLLGGEHSETVMMFAGDGDVLHAGTFRQSYNLRCTKFGRVELGSELFIFGDGDFFLVHHPFAPSGHTVYTPVDEHSEFGVLKPLAGFQVGFGWGVGLGKA